MNRLKYSLVTKLIFTNRIHTKFVDRNIRNDDILLFKTGRVSLNMTTRISHPILNPHWLDKRVQQSSYVNVSL